MLLLLLLLLLMMMMMMHLATDRPEGLAEWDYCGKQLWSVNKRIFSRDFDWLLLETVLLLEEGRTVSTMNTLLSNEDNLHGKEGSDSAGTQKELLLNTSNNREQTRRMTENVLKAFMGEKWTYLQVTVVIKSLTTGKSIFDTSNRASCVCLHAKENLWSFKSGWFEDAQAQISKDNLLLPRTVMNDIFSCRIDFDREKGILYI
ncbi:hypothetical protein BTVI_45023 [Pitangus sulphuratus]|nr:hypothetical protein BTVI_45023 [Pitangus sulphuratus]